MAAPSYGHDLSDFFIDTEKSVYELTAYAAGGTPVNNDTDDIIQGNNHASASASQKSGVASIVADYGSNVTLPSNGAFLIWHKFDAGGLLATIENGGIRACVGSALTAFDDWYVGGVNKAPYPYGGWTNFAIDPTLAYNNRTGTPTGYRYVGMAILLTGTGPSKGSPHKLDAIRYGRCEARFGAGDSGQPATLAGFAALNDASTARWGLIQAIAGGYQWKGLMTIGYGGACYFEDANTMVVIQDCRKVSASFNKCQVIEGSTFKLTNINFQALGTVSRGDFETVSGYALWNGVAWIDAGTFIHGSNDDLVGVTYRRCGQVTQGGAAMDACSFVRSYAAVALVSAALNNLTNCNFISAGTGHAVRATATGDFNWNGHTLSGYASSDGSTGNEAFYNDSGGHINLTILGGDTPSVRNGSGATTTVIVPEVSLEISAQVSLVGAEIRIYDLDDTLPYLGTELAGTESHDAATYTFNTTGGNVIWIQIMKSGYVEYGQQFTMPTADGELNVTLQPDLNA